MRDVGCRARSYLRTLCHRARDEDGAAMSSVIVTMIIGSGH
ncbi:MULTISPECIES: hypothetical protein [Actinomyces]|nr:MULTISPECIES: hypothetical protein [Actinomyces]